MTKWEYNVVNLSLPLPGGVLPHLNPLGEEGWEAIDSVKGTHGVTFLFKRPKQDAAPEKENPDAKGDGGLE